MHRDHNWRPPTKQEEIQKRIGMILDELVPLSQHSGIGVFPYTYDPEQDTLHLQIKPKSSPEWAKTVHEFSRHEGLKYDRDADIYGIDGQPRVSYSGMTWVRFISPFVDGSKVGLHIWSQQPACEDAEKQLCKLYGRFLVDDGQEPVDVFIKYL